MLSASLKLFLRESHVAFFSLSSLIFFIVSLLSIFVFIGPKSTLIPLHYNIFFGIDDFGPWYKTLYYPAIAFLLLCGNVLLSYYLYPKDKYNAYFLLATAMLSNLLVFLYVLSLIANNL